MGSPSIRIGIGVDDSASAALAEVQTKIQSFKMSAQGAGDGMTYAMDKARASTRLLSEEVGVKLPRSLSTVMAQSQTLGPMLATAFSAVAAVAFVEVLAAGVTKLTDWISKTYIMTDAMKAMNASQVEANKNIEKYNEEIAKNIKAGQLIGLTGSGKTSMETVQKQAEIDAVKEKIRALQDQMYGARNFPEVGTGVGSTQYAQWATQLGVLQKQLAALNSEQDNLIKGGLVEWHKEGAEAAKKQADEIKKLDAAAFKAAEDWKKVLEGSLKLQMQLGRQGMYSTQPGLPGAADVGGGLMLQGPQTHDLSDIQAEMDRSKRQTDWFNQTRTSAEQLDITIKQIHADFAGVTDPAALNTMNRAVDAANAKYYQTDKIFKQLGATIFQTMQQGILMGESFKNVMITLALEIGKAIIQFELLKAAKKNADGSDSGSDSSGGGGGIFGAILGGLFSGKAGGGPVSMGSSYLVGESGPELFTPRSSGVITPNSALGGNNYYIDARGGDAQTEMRVMRAIAQSENRAVARSVQAYQEVSLRR